MRLLNMCTFRVGDVVYWKEADYHTEILRIERTGYNDYRLWFRDGRGRLTYWFVLHGCPDHSGIRLVKRGE